MSIIENIARVGNPTSSEIVALTSMGTREMTEDELAEHRRINPKSKKKNIETWPGRAAITYINQCNMERRLGRSLDCEISAKPLTWGRFMEPIVFNHLLGDEYSYNSQETSTHPEYPFWAGSSDGFKFREGRTIAELKSPYTLESFCALVQPLYEGYEGIDAMNAIRFGYVDKNGLQQPPHKDGDKFFYQVVSNSCIEDCEYGELIIFCPYESEIPAIQHAAMNSGNPDYLWIYSASLNALPFIKDDGYYRNVNKIHFKIPQSEKDYLTELVIKAGKLLINI